MRGDITLGQVVRVQGKVSCQFPWICACKEWRGVRRGYQGSQQVSQNRIQERLSNRNARKRLPYLISDEWGWETLVIFQWLGVIRALDTWLIRLFSDSWKKVKQLAGTHLLVHMARTKPNTYYMLWFCFNWSFYHFVCTWIQYCCRTPEHYWKIWVKYKSYYCIPYTSYPLV